MNEREALARLIDPDAIDGTLGQRLASIKADRILAAGYHRGPRIPDLRASLDALPPGPWETWTSCSFRRITGPDGIDGGVLHALNQRSDGHPDLSWSKTQCEAICAIVNGLRAALTEETNDAE